MSSSRVRLSAPVRAALVAAAIVGAASVAAHASGGDAGGEAEFAKVLLALVVVLIAAKLGGDIFARLGQPAVLGELIFGIAIGNACLFGFRGFEFIENNEGVQILSHVGVTLLLFQVGLESDLAKMMKVGVSSLVVATLGIVVPFFLGFGAAKVFLPGSDIYTQVFIGATLCATSVGITARVLRDLGWLQTPEARIILGAAVIDDVQGLVILAVVSGVIAAASHGNGPVSAWSIGLIIFKATAFLVCAILIGRWIAPKVFHIASRLKAADLLLTTALGICFGFAYLASQIGLAPIVGAFAAGLILDEVHWRNFRDRGESSVEDLVKPLAALMVPVFFVVMGAQVDLSTFAQLPVLGLAAALTVAAIIGKQVCGLGVMQKGLDRLSVGIGMIPRGEVGLIFAAIGAQMKLHGEPVINSSVFSAIVIMVVVTTMMTPPALKWSVARSMRTRKVETDVEIHEGIDV